MPVARTILFDVVVRSSVWRSRCCVRSWHATAVPALLHHQLPHAWGTQQLRGSAVHFEGCPPPGALQTPSKGGHCSQGAPRFTAPYSSSALRQVLPRLPVPPLQETLHKYLKSVQPLVTEEELSNTRLLVEEFLSNGGLGERLQQHLLQRAASKDNWMSEWWLDSAYLQFRMPVVVWSSPGLVFPLVQFTNTQQQLNYAASLIAGALDYKTLLDRWGLVDRWGWWTGGAGGQ
ncbi:Acyltransferase ChoActase/COT/CPT, partial [Trinorchestia longiramus]